MLTALDKVLQSDQTLPADTTGARLHAAILDTKINGQLFWEGHASSCVVRVNARGFIYIDDNVGVNTVRGHDRVNVAQELAAPSGSIAMVTG